MGPVAVVIVAAGSGSRLGASVPKAFALLSGQSLLSRAAATAAVVPGVSSIIIVAPPSHLDEAASLSRDPSSGVAVEVVAGGVDRTASVAAGLAALRDDVDVVLVHDAARALAPATLFTAVIEAVRSGNPAVVPGLPVIDTVKQVDEHGFVVGTPDRSALRAIQTPQGFTRAVLDRAHASGTAATDDAALVEQLGLPVLVVAGDPLALKVTTADDIVVAERMLGDAPSPTRRRSTK